MPAVAPSIGNSKYWIGDYTIEPENGGVGVFAHEFGHDLGLPDEYDTNGNAGRAENSTGLVDHHVAGLVRHAGARHLGTYPVHFNAWDKFQLGFLHNYAVAHNTTAAASASARPSSTRQEPRQRSSSCPTRW